MCSTTISSSFYEAKRKLRDLGLRYETIHAYKYDCVLYWKEFVDLQDCPTCGEARYKINHNRGKKFRIRDKRVETNDVLRHPADVEGWKHFDSEFPNFAPDPRNVHLGLASDGFNPFGQMSTSYSMWHVMLLPYNLPPWKCTKETNFFMSLLILGPKTPALLWMINDFSAYGDLSRWSMKRYQTCSICMDDRSSFRIRGRISIMGHRRYLPENHMWHKSRLHDGKVELKAPPVVMNGHEILEQLDQLEFPVMKDKVISDFEIFKQKVRPLGASSVRAISQEEKRLFHWYILNNADEILEYRKHERAFPEWFRAQVLELRESANLSNDFFSLAMGPSFDIRCYNGCIVDGVRFHTVELDSRRTTQNSGIMIIGESDASGTGDNDFYGVLDEVLHVQYPLGRNVWLFKCRWYDTDVNKSQRTHVEVGYKSLNTSRFWYAEESVVLATQAHQVFYIDDPKNEIVVSHQVDDHIKDDTLCRNDVDPTIVERPIVRHVTDGFIDNVDEHLSHATIMSSSFRRNNFMETDAMFLEFEDDLDNIAGWSSSMGENTTGSSSQQPATPTLRRRVQSRLLELERHVAINGRIPMTIAPGVEKPISPHAIHFGQAIGVCVRKTFFVCCLKWADVGREYIEVVKGDLQRLFVLDFNDQAMNRFVEHQMFTTFKEFWIDCHRHFKKYSDPEEARANPPNALVGRHEDWHFLYDHYISHAFQEQSRTNKSARQKQPYNHSSGSKSFLQRQYELAERKGELVNRVELFQETHVRAGTFMSQAAEDAHNQMLELQSQPTPKGSQPLSEDEICDQVLGRRPGYSKGLGWGSKPKARRMTSASSSSTSCSQSTEKEIELQAKLNEALERIEVQDRNHQALASQVETMKKMTEELTCAQQDHHMISSLR
ncbi:CACTA en-spm transposon protein [Cucumis melo var. makuwa]|uniref:CACTA en-spm transposon protein n=1 Tax=Cucumis melo var. makuwa TaxID=1194695 RepID=A0A5A7UMS8_CUCMM|nr:CACTA en-spm transposon protein [Cucumis melo var. makuwa]